MKAERTWWVGMLVLVAACGGEAAESAAETPATPNAAAPTTPSSAAPSDEANTAPSVTNEVANAVPSAATDEAAPPAPAPVPDADLVDLLHAVRTEVATSTAYQDRDSQVRALVDGELETAWNSRTGDLQGAWIEVRIPEGARVQSIRMTAGFTKEGGDTDLFTGNHRVARVKVSHDGTELGVAELDVDSKALQALGDFGGGGGVYRLELVELRPGSNERWREACISELQFLGAAPSAAADTRVPTVAIGTLPPPYVPPVANREEVARTHVNRVGQIGSTWAELLLSVGGMDPSNPDDVSDVRAERRRWLDRFAQYVEPIDADAAGALQARSRVDFGDEPEECLRTLGDDLTFVSAALTSVAAYLGDDEARCRTARANAGMRLHLLEGFAIAPSDDPGDEPWEDAVMTARSAWSRDTQGTARRLERVERPRWEVLGAQWDAMLSEIATARTACGW